MALRLVFLGRLADLAGTAELAVAPGSLASVIAGLDPALAAALSAPTIRIARNGELIAKDASSTLADGDEIAFLPPVSGG